HLRTGNRPGGAPGQDGRGLQNRRAHTGPGTRGRHGPPLLQPTPPTRGRGGHGRRTLRTSERLLASGRRRHVRPVLIPELLTLSALTPAQAAPVVEAEPSRLILGPKARAEITVRGAGPGLRAAVSMGTLGPGVSGDGFTRFVWTPPADARAPALVLFAFWSGDAPSLSDITVLSLPCAVRTDLSIETEPSARVTVEVAGARFGPRRADGQGRLKMPVEVGPNAHEARVIA